MSVGVLALQGASQPHLEVFSRIGALAREVRAPADLAAVSHLVVPGGESTTIRHLLDLFGLAETIVSRARAGDLAILGTCAGAILLGRDDGERPRRFGLIDAFFERNAFGTQVDSFAAPLELAPPIFSETVRGETSHGETFRGVFIRAPRIRAVGKQVQVLGRWNGDPVLVRDGAFLAATFHPELSNDERIHRYFLTLSPRGRAAQSPQTSIDCRL